MSAATGPKKSAKAASAPASANPAMSEKSTKKTIVAATCVYVLTDPNGCPHGPKCRRDHTPARIVAEHKLVPCRNGYACAVVKAPLKRAQPLYTNPRFGATCIACVRSERRADRQAELAAEEKSQGEAPCRFFGRTIDGCRAGEKCKHEHNLLKCLDYYLLQWCPNQSKCVGVKHKGERLLCPSASQQCGECHQEMARVLEADKRARAKERAAAAASKKASVDQGETDAYNKPEPCRARDGCPNQTPRGRTCWECTALANEHAPPRVTQQRLGRLR